MPEVGGDVCEYVDPLEVSQIAAAMSAVTHKWESGTVDEAKLVERSKAFNKNDFGRLTYEAIIKTREQ